MYIPYELPSLDYTFCTAKCLVKECGRNIRPHQLKMAEKCKRPLSFSDFSEICENYREICHER